jgi:hypothetical protein
MRQDTDGWLGLCALATRPKSGELGETQDALDRALKLAALGGDRKTIERGGSKIELVDGLVRSFNDGKNHLEYTYKLGEDRKPLRNAKGEPILASVKGTIDGKAVDIDLEKAGKSDDPDQRSLADRISVAQSGNDIGDLTIVSPDGKTSRTTRASDFALLVHDRIPKQADGGEWRINTIQKLDGTTRVWTWDDANNNPTRLMAVNTYSKAGNFIEGMERRTNGFVFYANGQEIKKRLVADGDVDSVKGDYFYQEVREQWFSAPPRQVDGGLAAARGELNSLLSQHGINSGQVQTWMRCLEGKDPNGWVAKYREKGWTAPTDRDVAAFYKEMCGIFTEQRTGLGREVDDSERERFVWQALRMVGLERKFGQRQYDIPTCGICGLVSGPLIREALPQLGALWREALNTGRITSTGVNRNGNHRVVQLGRSDLHRTTNRPLADDITQKMLARLIGEDGGYDYSGTTADEAAYMYSFVTGKRGTNMPVIDVWTGRETNIPLTIESIVQTLKTQSIWYMEPGHAMSIVDARELPNGQWQLFLVNSHKSDNNEYSYDSRTGWYDAEALIPQLAYRQPYRQRRHG